MPGGADAQNPFVRSVQRIWRLMRRGVLLTVGALLVFAGVAGLVLPGPGLLIMFAGILVLSMEFEWAEKRVDFIRDRALDAAEYGVRTWPRIIASVLGGFWVIAAGVVWIISPQIPVFWIIGPHLPFAGLTTGLGMVISGFIALFLIVYSYRRFRSSGRVLATRD